LLQAPLVKKLKSYLIISSDKDFHVTGGNVFFLNKETYSGNKENRKQREEMYDFLDPSKV
jgi:hypothetical protein